VNRVVTQRDFDRFAALSRDDNPIHCDPAFARGTHFGATVAHGMFLYGLICGALTRHLAAPWMPIAQTLMFPAPTFARDATTVHLRASAPPDNFDVGVEVRRNGRGIDTAIGECVVLRAFAVDAGARPSTLRVDEPDTLPSDTGPDTLPLDTGPDTVPLADDRAAKSGAPPAEGGSLFGLAPGQRAKAARRFGHADLDEYAELCADGNPLVLDEAAARRAGLPARIVPGPLLSGMFSDLLGTKLPGRGTAWMKQSLRFVKPAHPGQLLQAMVEIVRVRPDKQLVNLRSTVRDISGALLVDGESLVLVRHLERARG